LRAKKNKCGKKENAVKPAPKNRKNRGDATSGSIEGF